jgi:hypothetical protein
MKKSKVTTVRGFVRACGGLEVATQVVAGQATLVGVELRDYITDAKVDPCCVRVLRFRDGIFAGTMALTSSTEVPRNAESLSLTQALRRFNKK